MEIIVSRFRECDIDTVFEIQRAAYKPQYEKYQDDSTNPYMESKETVLRSRARKRYSFLYNRYVESQH